jgi:vesicle-fusing ATPase
MSFFKRNDPNAPAARRGPSGGGASPSPYERLPADNQSYSSTPRQPSPQPPQPPRRVPPPQDFSQPRSDYGQPPPRQQQPQDGYDRGYQEKAEYRPQQGYQQQGQGYGQQQGGGQYGIAPCPSDPLALTNRLVVHPADFPPEVEFVILRNHFVLSIMYVLGSDIN